MPDPAPLLSVCIPTFNRAALLSDALAALAALDDLPFPIEIILSDNASTDDTPQILARAAERPPFRAPLRAFRHPANLGAEANLLSALRRARGKWCVYLADDDRLLPEPLARHVQALDATPGAAALFTSWLRHDARTNTDLPAEFDIPRAHFRADDAVRLIQWIAGHQVFPEIGIFRADAARNLRLYERTHWAFPWLLTLLRHGEVRFDPDSYYQFFHRPGVAHLGVAQAMTHLDHYQGGLDLALQMAIRLAPDRATPAAVAEAERLIRTFMEARYLIAARLLQRHNRPLQALEISRRVRHLPEHRDEWRQYLPLATVALLQQHLATADATALLLAPDPALDGLARLLASLPNLTLTRATPAPGQHHPDALALLRDERAAAPLRDASPHPERVLSLEQLQQALAS